MYDDEPTDPYGYYTGEVELIDPVEDDGHMCIIAVIVWSASVVAGSAWAASVILLFLLAMVA